MISLMNTNGLVSNNISTLAQDSLHKVQRLRILLTNLVASIETDDQNLSDEEAIDKLNDDQSNKPLNPKAGSPICPNVDLKLLGPGLGDPHPCSSAEAKLKRKIERRKLMLHRTIGQISEIFHNLDQLAARMHTCRLSSPVTDLGVQNALSLFTTVDQLEFGRQITTGYGFESETPTKDCDFRRFDWLVDRMDADRWSHQYWERTQTVLEGLLVCGALRRSNVNLERSRYRPDMLADRDYRTSFEHLIHEMDREYPDLTITLVEPISSIALIHVRVGDVMQCYINFRQLNPERIIVRGLSEPMVIKLNRAPNTFVLGTSGTEPEGLLSTIPQNNMLSAQVNNLISSFLTPDQWPRSVTHDSGRSRSGGGNSKLNRACFNQSQKPDLYTPSKHLLFQRITALAQCALLHFSNKYKPGSAVGGILSWLHSYRDLFTAPCARCGHLLGQNVDLPVWRSYPQLRKDNMRPFEPQHEHCQAIS